MKKIKHIQIIVGIMIFIVIIFFISIRRKEGHYSSSLKLTKLPEFEAININGGIVKNSDFKGRNLYIQFINSSFRPDLYLFESVYSKWINEDLYFLAIISDSINLNLKNRFDSNNITFIEKNYYDLCPKFNLNPKNGYFFLVNKKGTIISSGRNDLGYEKGPKIFLQGLIKGDFFSISELIIENKNINNFKWFSQVNNLIKNNNDKEYFIISLFTEICDSCSGGELFIFLKK